MSINIVKAGAVVILAVQPMLAGAATIVDVQPAAVIAAGESILPPKAAEVSSLLLAQQGSGQGQAQGQSQGQSQGQNNAGTDSNNTNQNTNQNENQNRNRNRNDESEGQLAAATAQAVTKAIHVCFYDGADFAGARFCAEPGDQATSSPAGWNDRISSIEIVGSASVKVCSDAGFAGTCKVLSSSAGTLGDDLNDAISSWSVE